jgi:hypothetical protein
MRRARAFTAFLGALLLLAFTVSSARADSFRADDMVGKLKSNQGNSFNLPDDGRAGTISLFAEIFEGNNGLHLGQLKNNNGLHLGLLKNNEKDFEVETNNGKHLGFSMTSTNPGNRFGLFQGAQSPQTSAGTIPNPEPAAVFLFGTGLAAAAGLARKRFRKSND